MPHPETDCLTLLLPIPLNRLAGADDAARDWLARARRQDADEPGFERLLAALGDAAADAGRAALRLWGQTGERPGDWVAAADPVCSRAGLERLHLALPPAGDIAHAELRALCRDIEERLLVDARLQLQAVGDRAYLRGERECATAAVPPERVDPDDPAASAPGFDEARDWYELLSEAQMCLHAHPVNAAREAAGRLPLNDLWLWGGGRVGNAGALPLPGAFSDDPLVTGYWYYRDAPVGRWPGSIAACLAEAPGGFVAAPPAGDCGPGLLAELRSAWRASSARTLRLICSDCTLTMSRGLFGRWRRRDRLTLRELAS